MGIKIIDRIFGTNEAIEATVETISKGLDKLVYTKEERAEDQAKAVTEARSLLVEWMKQSSGQNLARRWLAVNITKVWLAQYIVSMVLAVGGTLSERVSTTLSSACLAAAGMMAGYANAMSDAVMLILGFYFAGPYLGQFVEAILRRFNLRLPEKAGAR